MYQILEIAMSCSEVVAFHEVCGDDPGPPKPHPAGILKLSPMGPCEPASSRGIQT